MTADLTHATAAQLADDLRARRVSSVEVTRAHLDRIDAVDGAVHAFLHRNDEEALAVAAEVDAARSRGEELPPLAGVPVAVKDVACTIGQPTTAGSRILQGWLPPYDATCVRRLRAARMPILGKTNMDEFAMGSSTEHSAYGPTGNPWDTTRVPGGSGGGSAASLAAYLAPLAVGSDTGGSIRQPAALTGTVGAKPTYGGISRYGVIAMASSLDQIGPCGRTVLDTALLHEVLAGHDPLDSTSLDAPVPPVVDAARHGDVAGMRIGIIAQIGGAATGPSAGGGAGSAGSTGFQEGVLARFAEAIEVLRDAGATVTVVDCPNLEHSLAAYYLIMMSEASSNLARYDAVRYGLRVSPGGSAGSAAVGGAPSIEQVTAASRGAGFGAETKRRIMLGTYALSAGYYDAYYGKAQKVRTLIARDFEAAFGQVDVLVSPTTPTTAWELGAKLDDPLAMYLGDVSTIPSNLAGLPGISVPAGLADEDGLPVGFQVLAPAMADERMYAVAAAVERALTSRWGGPLLDRLPALPATAGKES